MERSILGIAAAAVICARYAPQELADLRNRGRAVVARAAPVVKARHLLLVWVLIIAVSAAEVVTARDVAGLTTFTGLLVFLAGSVLGLVGFRQLGRSYSAELVLYSESRLVSKGIYRVIRHPIRLGLALETLGLILLSEQFGLVPVWLLYCWALVRRSEVEDHFLRGHFGQAVIRYQENVPPANLFVGLFRLLRRRWAKSVFAARHAKRLSARPLRCGCSEIGDH